MDRHQRIAKIEEILREYSCLENYPPFDDFCRNLRVALRVEKLELACVLARHAINRANEQLKGPSLSRRIALEHINELVPENDDVL